MPLPMYPSHDRWETVEELTELAGTATEAPAPPLGGIPKQWLPGWIRWPIRVLMLPWVQLDLMIQRIAKKIVPPPFRQKGYCLQRGNCCHYVLLPEPRSLMTRLFYFWFTQVDGFYPRHPDPIESEGERMMVMGCRYLQPDGRCGQYRLRPMLCREWPLIERFDHPRILKGCGFYAEPRFPTKANSN